MDRTDKPTYSLSIRRKGKTEAEAIPLAPSGEIFELEEELRRTVEAFRDRRPLVAPREAKRRIVICLEAERALREGREVVLQP